MAKKERGPYVNVGSKLKAISDIVASACRKNKPKLTPLGFRQLRGGERMMAGDMYYYDGEWEDIPVEWVNKDAPTPTDLSKMIMRVSDVEVEEKKTVYNGPQSSDPDYYDNDSDDSDYYIDNDEDWEASIDNDEDWEARNL